MAMLPPSTWASPSTLDSIAAASGRYFGTAVRRSRITADHDLTALVARECGSITPELEFKWEAFEESRQAGAAAVAGFARRNGQRLRGHALLWHRSIPPRVVGALRDTPDWRSIARHFAAIIPPHRDVVTEWDVVNEPIDTGFRMDGLRISPLLEAFGPDYIRRALEEARRHAPAARLYINEYGLEYDLLVEKHRRYLFLKLLERLKAEGAPLDGVGLQAHLDLNKGQVAEAEVDRLLTDIENLGLSIAITELDVKEADLTLDSERRDQHVADAARRYLDVVLSHRGIVGVTTWGLSDRQSWLEVTADDRARFPGAWQDGTSPGVNRGLPFDSSLQEKPLRNAIAAAFRHATPASRA